MISPGSPVKALEKKREALVSRFLKGNEPEFLERQTEILDHYFYESFARSRAGLQMPMDKNPCAVIALGGYGRKEQYLQSDVDVLLLFKNRIPDEAAGLVQEIFYPLWDIRLQVSYAIRTLKDCFTLASEDFEILTSLMDARFVCGVSTVYSDLRQQLDGTVLPLQGGAYLEWLSERIRMRHERFGDSTYLLEPNLKEGLGGLRDYHTMLWIARVAHDITEPRGLEFYGHLSHDEFQALSKAVSFIGTVRNRLHYLTGRKCDQLYFEYQVKLAKALGSEDENVRRAVETFLGTLHGTMECVKRQHLMFLGRALRTKQKTAKRKEKRRTLTAGVEIVDDSLHFESPEVLLEKPYLLVNIFEQSAILGLPLGVEAGRLVREFLHLVDDKFRRSRRVVNSFRRILAAPPRAFNVLNAMLNTGLMVSLIPEMEGVVNRIQYDEYHVYPVDKHLLRTVQTLKEFSAAGPGTPDAFYGKLFREIQAPELLLWSGLLHDVGKAVDEKEHGSHGAEMARQILERMGFPVQDIETVAFLVREHLFLMHTATRRDINDERVVIQCAGAFPDVEHLKMLYLLTVADAKATGLKAWTDWRGMLLKELFFKLLHVLEGGELATPDATGVVERKKYEVIQNAGALPQKLLETLFDHMSPRYLLYTPSRDIRNHIAQYQRLGDQPFCLEVQADSMSSYKTVTLCARDFPGLFSQVAGVFTLNNLNILSAEIYTWRNHIAFDVFRVESSMHNVVDEEVWTRVRADLHAVLKGELALEPALSQKVQTYRSLQKALPRKSDKILVDNDTSDFFTIIEIHTHDFPGLLYKLTSTLFHCKLDIWVAKIATKVDQVVDVFYARDFDGQKVDSAKEVAALKKAIEETLAEGPVSGIQGTIELSRGGSRE